MAVPPARVSFASCLVAEHLVDWRQAGFSPGHVPLTSGLVAELLVGNARRVSHLHVRSHILSGWYCMQGIPPPRAFFTFCLDAEHLVVIASGYPTCWLLLG